VLQGLRSVVRDVNFATFGVPATVQVPLGPPVATRVIWLQPTTEPRGPRDFSRAEQRKVVAIRRDDLPAVPRDTVITIPEGGINYRWKVDGIEAVASDRHHVVVVPMAPAP
jgi:hypothetical protein